MKSSEKHVRELYVENDKTKKKKKKVKTWTDLSVYGLENTT